MSKGEIQGNFQDHKEKVRRKKRYGLLFCLGPYQRIWTNILQHESVDRFRMRGILPLELGNVQQNKSSHDSQTSNRLVLIRKRYSQWRIQVESVDLVIGHEIHFWINTYPQSDNFQAVSSYFLMTIMTFFTLLVTINFDFIN